MVYQQKMEADVFEVNKDGDCTIFKGDICGPIAQTMNELMFQLVVSKWRNAFDGLKETKDYKFLSAAGSFMKTMVIFNSKFVILLLLAQQIYGGCINEHFFAC